MLVHKYLSPSLALFNLISEASRTNYFSTLGFIFCPYVEKETKNKNATKYFAVIDSGRMIDYFKG